MLSDLDYRAALVAFAREHATDTRLAREANHTRIDAIRVDWHDGISVLMNPTSQRAVFMSRAMKTDDLERAASAKAAEAAAVEFAREWREYAREQDWEYSVPEVEFGPHASRTAKTR
jgi:hypothetical protein